MTVIVSASYVLVADISSLYFRTHTNLPLQDEVREVRNDDDDDDDNDDDDVAVETASASHTPSPSLSTSSNISKRKKKHDTSDLCATLTKFIASREKPESECMKNKSQLTAFFEDIAETIIKFPEVQLAETKREIFNLVSKKEIELLTQKQVHMLSYPHQYENMPSPPVHQTNYFSTDSFQNEPPTNSQCSEGFIPNPCHKLRQKTHISQIKLIKKHSYASH
jgi:hypothetical protein